MPWGVKARAVLPRAAASPRHRKRHGVPLPGCACAGALPGSTASAPPRRRLRPLRPLWPPSHPRRRPGHGQGPGKEPRRQRGRRPPLRPRHRGACSWRPARRGPEWRWWPAASVQRRCLRPRPTASPTGSTFGAPRPTRRQQTAGAGSSPTAVRSPACARRPPRPARASARPPLAQRRHRRPRPHQPATQRSPAGPTPPRRRRPAGWAAGRACGAPSPAARRRCHGVENAQCR
mmetsp:Transcript_21586/g.59904  ORF Transcript_21586/g.59904 Transcript_21586/m.59904 type:complete len:233 (+) Transcript_21586:323-1021(+)